MEDRERRIGWWVSGGAHTALLLWAIIGGVFFRPQESTPVRSTQVATISGAEFEALAAASRGAGPVDPEATAVATMSEPAVEDDAGTNPAAASAPEPEAEAQELAQPDQVDSGPDLSDFANEAPVEVATDLPNAPDNRTESRDVTPESPAQAQAPAAESQPTQPQVPQTDQAAAPVAPRSELALDQSVAPRQRPDGLVENYRARVAAREAAQQAAAEAARAAAEAAEEQRLTAEREAAEEARREAAAAAEREEARRQAEAEAAAEEERQAEEARAAERREAAERRAEAEREAAAQAEREQAEAERAEREAEERRAAEAREAEERRAEEERREAARREAEQAEQERREAEAREAEERAEEERRAAEERAEEERRAAQAEAERQEAERRAAAQREAEERAAAERAEREAEERRAAEAREAEEREAAARRAMEEALREAQGTAAAEGADTASTGTDTGGDSQMIEGGSGASAEQDPLAAALAGAMGGGGEPEPTADPGMAEPMQLMPSPIEPRPLPDPAEAAPENDTYGMESGAPTSEPLSLAERDAFRVALRDQWNIGALSAEGLQMHISVAFDISRNGRPDPDSIRLVDHRNGSDAAARQMFEVARRGIIMSGRSGFPLPPGKYDRWRKVVAGFSADGVDIE